MKGLIGILFILGVVGSPIAADEALSVLCYGDSITAGAAPAVSYPAHLQAIRPDLAVVNGGLGGDVSWNRERYEELLDSQRFDVVVIMIGTNDPVFRPAFPAQRTFRNIARMARIARHEGAEVIVLTQTPALGASPLSIRRQNHTRAVAHRLTEHFAGRRHSGILLADLRNEFTARDWEASSEDGLHPNQAGARTIAAFVSRAIETIAADRRDPRTGAPRGRDRPARPPRL